MTESKNIWKQVTKWLIMRAEEKLEQRHRISFSFLREQKALVFRGLKIFVMLPRIWSRKGYYYYNYDYWCIFGRNDERNMNINRYRWSEKEKMLCFSCCMPQGNVQQEPLVTAKPYQDTKPLASIANLSLKPGMSSSLLILLLSIFHIN